MQPIGVERLLSWHAEPSNLSAIRRTTRRKLSDRLRLTTRPAWRPVTGSHEMPPAGEMLMSVDEDRVLKEANLLAMRSIQDAVKSINTNMDTMRKDVQDVRERMIRVEERDTRADVAALSVRVQALESDRSEKRGQAGAVGWLISNWQALAMFVGVFYLIAKQGGTIP